MTGEYKTWRGLDYHPARETILPYALLPYLRKQSCILVVGCHQGSEALFLAEVGHRVHGIDINPEAIRTATHRAKDAGLSAVVHFEVADLLGLDPERRFDAVTMIRFLTCLPDTVDWQQAISRAKGMLAKAGLLYIHDFLLTTDSEDYRRRYDEGAALGWRRGNFAVREPNGTLQFIAHHHSPEEVAELCAGCRTEIFRTYTSISMHGNEVLMFERLLRKLTSSA